MSLHTRITAALFAILLTLSFPLNALAVDISTLLDNKVAHWEFEEASGNRADSTGNGYTLTANGTGGIPSASPSCGYADGADLETSDVDYFSRASFSATNSNTSFSFWWKPETLPASGGYHQFVFKWGAIGARAWNGPYVQNVSGTYRLYMDYRSSSNQTTSGYTTHAFSAGSCYHIAIVVNPASKTFAMYVNAASKSVTYDAQVATAIATGASDLFVGGDGSSGVDGVINEFTITSDALSADEVASIYNGGAGIAYVAPPETAVVQRPPFIFID